MLQPRGLARRAAEQCRHLAPRAASGVGFECAATGHHERDDGGGQRLAEHERKPDREPRQNVDARLALYQTLTDNNRQRCPDSRRPGEPKNTG